MLILALIAIFPACMITAASSDLMTMKISNKLTLILSVAFAVAAFVVGIPLEMIAVHVVVGSIILSLTFFAFAMGWMGGGDAKLMASTALWFGPTADLMSYLLIGGVYGGVLTLGLLAGRGFFAPVTGIAFIDRLLYPDTGIPYGIALGLAGLTVFAGSNWMDLAVGK